ncbi:MAG: AmmeMemoRadiSam system protein B [Candidatus Omnitrophota bacterium]
MMNHLKFTLYLFTMIVGALGVNAENIKTAEFAGTFYPDGPKNLEAMIDGFFDDVDYIKSHGQIIGIIVPHAGYVYSGPVAAYAFKAIAGNTYDTVILLGASHRYSFRGVSVYPNGFFTTPLGNFEVDSELAQSFKHLPFVNFDTRYFNGEHSLEVELPFLKKSLKDVRIVPIIFGSLNYDELSQLAKELAEASKIKKVLVLVSTDLSHYFKYDQANKIDEKTIKYIEDKNAFGLWVSNDLGENRACGIMPLIAFLSYASLKQADMEILKYANSGDTASDKERVVGYVSAIAHIK